MALQLHPDRHMGKRTEKDAAEKFKSLQSAHDILSDVTSKQAYDKTLGLQQVYRSRLLSSMSRGNGNGGSPNSKRNNKKQPESE